MKNSGRSIPKSDIIPPQYISADAVIDRCLIGEGAEIYGEVHNSVIGPNVSDRKGQCDPRFYHYAECRASERK